MSLEVLGSNTCAQAGYNGHADHRHDAGTAVSSFFRWRWICDRPLATLLLVICSPLIGVLWLLVRSTSPGPGLFQQARVGRNGKTFIMLKLRTMRHDAEVVTGPVWCSVRDPRITSLGWLLRRSHLDELPQLWNIVKGEMSLVGPRPERPEFVEVLSTKLDRYRDRMLVTPGITGLAQLNLPPDTDLNSVARKLVLDLEYIQQGGPALELRILIATFLRLCGLRDGVAVRLLQLKRTPLSMPMPRKSVEIQRELTAAGEGPNHDRLFDKALAEATSKASKAPRMPV